MEHNVPAIGLPGGNIWECMHSSMENHSDLDGEGINSPFTKTTKRFSLLIDDIKNIYPDHMTKIIIF